MMKPAQRSWKRPSSPGASARKIWLMLKCGALVALAAGVALWVRGRRHGEAERERPEPSVPAKTKTGRADPEKVLGALWSGDETALDELVERLKGRIPDAERRRLLETAVRHLRSDPRLAVRQRCARYLFLFGAPAVPALLDVLHSQDETAVLRNAAFSLADIGSESALDDLYEIARAHYRVDSHRSATIGGTGIYAIGHIGGVKAAQLLSKLWEGVPEDPSLTDMGGLILSAMGDAGHPMNVAHAEEALGYPALIGPAANTLSELARSRPGDPDVAQRIRHLLRQVLTRQSDPYILNNAVQGLSYLGTAEDIPDLEEVLRRAPDPILEEPVATAVRRIKERERQE